ncbi:MAG TPA: YbhB/YbcL family Raf kinase inhibitor-like protein [Solirubrobacterales bacterium]|nr:YbhB/YbcL family Raf kinase inhibitor-like protein [Solirubrobacterales bacterium]
MASFSLTSPAFEDGGDVPARHTCEGENVSPELAWSGVPERTRALALIVDDPDAPRGTFTHWLAWNIAPGEEALAERGSPPVEGENDAGTTGYHGPCPPPGHGRHRYFFRLHALDAELELDHGAPRDELERALDGHVLGTAELVGGYER